MKNTGDPLSPAPTIWTVFCTISWHNNTMFDPETPTFTQLFVTVPSVQPVVRPTLSSVWPTVAFPAASAVIVNEPAMSRDPLFAPVVCAMPPSVNATPLAPWEKFASLRRHFRPWGQPWLLRKNDGSAISVPINSAVTWSSGW